MKRQIFTLPKYDWRITVFYDTKPQDIGYIIEALEDLDCPIENIERSYYSIVDGGDNAGLTYTNTNRHESVISIGHASTLAQFLNTSNHEIFHVCKHIAEYYNIDPFGEPIAYLAGDISEKMHPLLEPYMCSCKGGCSCKNKAIK